MSTPANSSTEAILQKLQQLLRPNKLADAVRMLNEALENGLVSRELSDPAVILANLDRESAAKLIQAYARYKCFYCRKGLEPCRECSSASRRSAARYCETCLGLRVVRCDFCDGSGWATYNIVPVGLRLPVAAARTAIAQRELSELLKRSQQRPADLKLLGTRLVALNRYAGIFENALDAARRVSAENPAAQTAADRIRDKCLAAWKRIEPAMREHLVAMSAVLSRQAERTQDNGRRKLILVQKSALAALAAAPTFVNTSLEHAFLRSGR